MTNLKFVLTIGNLSSTMFLCVLFNYCTHIMVIESHYNTGSISSFTFYYWLKGDPSSVNDGSV